MLTKIICLLIYHITWCIYNTVLGESCSHGNVRLVEGPVSSEGRLEICLQRRWGSVCYFSWDTRESSIACEQLGFQSESE